MIVDCERCPGQHLSPPACPSCVVQLLLPPAPGLTPPRPGGGVPVSVRPDRVYRPDRTHGPDRVPVELTLVRRTDDHGRELDAREQRAVAVLAAAGLLPIGEATAAERSGTGGSRRTVSA